MIVRLLLIAGLLAGMPRMACAAEANPLRDNWLELSSHVDTAYKKALRCEAGARKSDRSQCADFSGYMKLFYPRIAYLNTSINNLPPAQLQKLVAPRDYENYKLKFNKLAEVSNAWGD